MRNVCKTSWDTLYSVYEISVARARVIIVTFEPGIMYKTTLLYQSFPNYRERPKSGQDYIFDDTRKVLKCMYTSTI